VRSSSDHPAHACGLLLHCSTQDATLRPSSRQARVGSTISRQAGAPSDSRPPRCDASQRADQRYNASACVPGRCAPWCALPATRMRRARRGGRPHRAERERSALPPSRPAVAWSPLDERAFR
jgi:hypothetical protein